jgi:hypothetical protein
LATGFQHSRNRPGSESGDGVLGEDHGPDLVPSLSDRELAFTRVENNYACSVCRARLFTIAAMTDFGPWAESLSAVPASKSEEDT